LEADFAVRRVWTVAAGQGPRTEWLVFGVKPMVTVRIRCSIPGDTPEDAKTEIGWDEFQAQKYRGWEHHLALTAAALWFVAQTKLEWAQAYTRDPDLARELEVEVLPALSTANVRELLKAVLPLPQLTPEQATNLVIRHLVNRARSTSSRLKSQAKHCDPP
jgi:hypothetical protein